MDSGPPAVVRAKRAISCLCCANANGKHAELVPLWRRMDDTGSFAWARRICRCAFLSILPDSAGPERIFRDLGMYTMRRNRLNPPKVHNAFYADRHRRQVAAGVSEAEAAALHPGRRSVGNSGDGGRGGSSRGVWVAMSKTIGERF